jgi:hypothetical protein
LIKLGKNGIRNKIKIGVDLIMKQENKEILKESLKETAKNFAAGAASGAVITIIANRSEEDEDSEDASVVAGALIGAAVAMGVQAIRAGASLAWDAIQMARLKMNLRNLRKQASKEQQHTEAKEEAKAETEQQQ